MIVSTIRIHVSPDKHQDALRILRSFTMSARDQSGSVKSHIYRDIEDNNVFMLQELWESEKHLTLHVRSDSYRTILLAMDMSFKKPEVKFDKISGSTGFESIVKMRSDAAKGKKGNRK